MLDVGILMRLLVMIVVVYFTFRLVNSAEPSIQPYTETLVRIDSVSTRTKYTFVPDTIWTYHTKYGPTLYSTTNKYNVGDSILINLVKKDSHE